MVKRKDMRLEEIGGVLRDRGFGKQLAIVTDSNIKDLYLTPCSESLEEAGFIVHSFVVEAGEKSKSLETYGRLLKGFAAIPLNRDDCVIALGGGMVGDLAGFAASTYMRGIRLVQVPTSLLAYVDSSIGGKTGIDLSEGKNLVGSFYEADYIFRDPSMLISLPGEEVINGMAEIIKYGIIDSPELFDILKDPSCLKEKQGFVLNRCIEIKEDFVRSDPMDRGRRQMLNFGHTLGHAVESLSSYRIRHGYAVAKGMMMETEMSLASGICKRETVDAVRLLLESYGFDLNIEWEASILAGVIGRDKKKRGDEISLVLPREVGLCVIEKIPMRNLQALMEEVMRNRCL